MLELVPPLVVDEEPTSVSEHALRLNHRGLQDKVGHGAIGRRCSLFEQLLLASTGAKIDPGLAGCSLLNSVPRHGRPPESYAHCTYVNESVVPGPLVEPHLADTSVWSKVRTQPDLLIAAAAEAGSVPVLHYDHDYDLIAEVSGQVVRWILPAGSLS